jgi:hypothetical protein
MSEGELKEDTNEKPSPALALPFPAKVLGVHSGTPAVASDVEPAGHAPPH